MFIKWVGDFPTIQEKADPEITGPPKWNELVDYHHLQRVYESKNIRPRVSRYANKMHLYPQLFKTSMPSMKCAGIL